MQLIGSAMPRCVLLITPSLPCPARAPRGGGRGGGLLASAKTPTLAAYIGFNSGVGNLPLTQSFLSRTGIKAGFWRTLGSRAVLSVFLLEPSLLS